MKKTLLILGLMIGVGASAQVVNTFPYNEDFEGETQGAMGCSSPYTMVAAGWSNDLTESSQDWQGDINGTTSGSTGPTANGGADHNPGIAGGKYMVIETSSGCGDNTSEVNLESTWFDFTAVATGEMSFWYHLFGGDMATALMHVDTRTGQGTPWTNDVVPAWTDNVDLWQEQLVDLGVNGLTGQDSVQFRIRFKVGSGFTSDAAIDDFSVYETNFNGSITGVQEILCAGASTGSMIAVNNYGVMPITYLWDNGAVTDTITGLAPGTYCVTMTDSNGDVVNACATIVDTAVLVEAFISGTPEFICADSMGMLVIDSIIGGQEIPTDCGISPYGCDGVVDSLQVGTNDILVGGTTYPSPLGNWYWGTRHQMVYQASELLTAGVQPGNLSGLAFFIDNLGTADANLTGWNIKLGCTSDSTATVFNDTSTVEVYPMTDITIVAGWNWYTFANSFYWNGSDNIIVETCFNNAGYTNNPNMACEITALNTTVYYRADNGTVCGNSNVTGTSPNRPIIQFENCSVTLPAFSYDFSWNTGETTDTINAIAGTPYTLTITDNLGCQVQVTDSLEASNPVLTATSTDVMLGSDGTVDLTATGASVPFTFDWDNDGTGDNDDTEDLTGLVGGDYTVNVIDVNGCSSTITVTVNSQLGLGDNALSTFNVYPNPTNGIFYIEPLSVNGENVTGQIVDVTGKVIKNITFNGIQTVEVNLSNVERGVYFINISVDGNTTITKILVD